MSRYIDVDELLKEYRERRDAAIKWNSDCDKEYKDRAEQAIMTFNECMLTLTNQPTADVRENVKGEWLPHPIKGNREWDVCSACGVGCKRREYGIHANGEKWVTEYNFSFCPNCGAQMMRGKQDG